MPPGPDNAAGYWEIQPIKEFDDELLAHLGGAWDFPPRARARLGAATRRWRRSDDRATSIVTEAFGTELEPRRAPIAIKDPRISLLHAVLAIDRAGHRPPSS